MVCNFGMYSNNKIISRTSRGIDRAMGGGSDVPTTKLKLVNK